MMEQIRYTQRICSDTGRIDNFLYEKRVGTLSMCDSDGKPYGLPMNYVYMDGKIYVHGMGSGKKNEILLKNPSVCFTVNEEFGTVKDSMPCKCDTSYFSVLMFGDMILVKDAKEKAKALMGIVDKFVPGLFKSSLTPEYVDKYCSAMDNMPVAVYCLIPRSITAKENPIDLENMFTKISSMHTTNTHEAR